MIAEADAARQGAPASAPVASAGAPAAAAQPAAANAASAITGSVTIDPALRDRVAASDTLFVFARAVEVDPEDAPSRALLSRCDRHMAAPPQPFDGVVDLDK